ETVQRRRSSLWYSSPVYPLRHRLGLVGPVVQGDQHEKQEIDQRQQPGEPCRPVFGIERVRPAAGELTPDRNRHRAEIAQYQKTHDENREPALVERAAIADRLDGPAV